ncbi:hypothetical protein Ah1_00299 [Aeromonas phage Ah1]|uniref:Uncharacterized protein n=1 Tax=Aeromonas phage Ah1 TaxID=2053701 RepID=A0A2H4YF76_9CAUD|nr:hypothetical protein KNT77_gp219 [Aeromonas phage Ah1]AUE22817.1 hypothetical protein Ah1_00299 [Aeromonas phage Ah1]
MKKLKFRLLKNIHDVKAGSLVEDVMFTPCLWLRKDMSILTFFYQGRKITKVVTGDMEDYLRRVQ